MLTLLLAAVLGTGIRGTWTILADGDRVQLTVVRDQSNWGQSIRRRELPLTDAQINSTTETPVHFALNRDAGVIDFNGSFERGEGVGRFVFTPGANYVAALRSLSVASDDVLDDEKLFSLAMHDVSANFIRDMQTLGYRENLQSYVRFRIHGVSTDFVRDLRSHGYDKLTAEDLVRFRIHGVTPEFVKAMRDMDVRALSSESVVRMRIHGVSESYVRDLRDLGYTSLSSDDLVRMRIHDVSASFIRELANAGYHGIPVDKLVQMRIHGISPSMLSRTSDQ